MSVVPSGAAGSFAGVPLAQTKGSDIERAQQDTQTRARQAKSEARSADAAGVAAADGEDTQAQERDADGRRLWERPLKQPARPETTEPSHAEIPRQTKDPRGESGSQLDLTG